jgi:hypothetical protein
MHGYGDGLLTTEGTPVKPGEPETWYVQYMRPDGWWSLADDEGVLEFDTEEDARVQMADQLEAYPHAQYRVSRESGETDR